QTPNSGKTIKPASVVEEEQNRTLRRSINVKARDVQQKIESIREMAMPGFGYASSILAIMILYAMRRIF
ncbi:hypothetical protein DRN77_02315, partial [Methanosarcinales archaeon]